MKAADEIIAAQKEDPKLSFREIDRLIGHGGSVGRYSGDLVRWRTGACARTHLPFGRDEKDTHEIRQQRDAEKVLADPEQRRQVMASLPPEQVEAVIADANHVAIERMQAKRAEHDATAKTPVAGDLMGERFDPSESWADEHIIRVREKAHTLRRQVEKWGLVLGSLGEEQAFDYLQEAERNIAEVRVVLQERMADRDRAEA